MLLRSSYGEPPLYAQLWWRSTEGAKARPLTSQSSELSERVPPIWRRLLPVAFKTKIIDAISSFLLFTPPFFVNTMTSTGRDHL